MQNTTINTQTAAVNQVINVDQVIATLRGLNESRLRAYNFYPHSVKTDKWDAVTIIRDELNSIPKMLTRRMQVLALLKLHNHFLRIQPFTTKKLNETYLQKLAMQMDACRNDLGRQQQNLRLG